MPTDPICLRCGKPLEDHQRWTAEDVAASKATNRPTHDDCIGTWKGHDPLMQRPRAVCTHRVYDTDEACPICG